MLEETEHLGQECGLVIGGQAGDGGKGKRASSYGEGTHEQTNWGLTLILVLLKQGIGLETSKVALPEMVTV